MTSWMPLPFWPVPGNSLFAGIWSIEYQYMPGIVFGRRGGARRGDGGQVELRAGRAFTFGESTSP